MNDKPKKNNKNKCNKCKKNNYLLMKCKCNNDYCLKCLQPELHECVNMDKFRIFNKDKLHLNEKIVPNKIDII